MKSRFAGMTRKLLPAAWAMALAALLTWRWNHEMVRLYDLPPLSLHWALLALLPVAFWLARGESK